MLQNCFIDFVVEYWFGRHVRITQNGKEIVGPIKGQHMDITTITVHYNRRHGIVCSATTSKYLLRLCPAWWACPYLPRLSQHRATTTPNITIRELDRPMDNVLGGVCPDHRRQGTLLVKIPTSKAGIMNGRPLFSLTAFSFHQKTSAMEVRQSKETCVRCTHSRRMHGMRMQEAWVNQTSAIFTTRAKR